MKRPQFFFFQGSTPTLALQLPYAIEAGDAIYATFSQGEQTVTEYRLDPNPQLYPAPTGTLTVDADEPSRIRIAMSQRDTFLFEPGDCTLQLRTVKPTGAADTLFPVCGRVGKAQKREVI